MSKSARPVSRKTPLVEKKISYSLLLPDEKIKVGYVLACAVITVLFFIPALFNGFTNWDDNGYVTGNNLLKSLSPENLKIILTKPILGNYHPLTILSYAIEYHFVEYKPFLYHLTNIVFHTVNTVLVFVSAFRLSKSNLTAVVTALLFALHPMHVESVAWVSERKDVLFCCFFMASVSTYISYATGKGRSKLYISCFLFLISLLCKGQGASLPVLLLVIDYWLKRPLKRNLLIEKIPFFLLALVFGIIAVKVQQSFGYMTAMRIYSFTDRLWFAAYALVLYLVKLVFPFGLSCFYPFPTRKSALIYLSPILLGVLSYILYRNRKSSRLYIFGFLFFFSTIALVLQVIAVGGAVISERYTYIPYIGLFFIAGEELNNRIHKNKSLQTFLLSFTALILLSYGIGTLVRTQVWKNSVKLWSDVIEKDSKVAIAYNNRASAYKDEKKNELALADYNKALIYYPGYFEALSGRGEVLRLLGRYDEALADLNKAITIKPDGGWNVYMSRAIVFCIKGQLADAKRDFDKALSEEKNSAELYCNLGNYYDMSGNYSKGIECYSHAIELNPDYEIAYLSRGTAKARKGYNREAIDDLSMAIKIKPDYGEAYNDRAYTYNAIKEPEKAIHDLLKAKELGVSVNESFLKQLQENKK